VNAPAASRGGGRELRLERGDDLGVLAAVSGCSKMVRTKVATQGAGADLGTSVARLRA
jgi:hypothetical protein